MYFPRYWQRATVKGPNREGNIFETTAWGWSDTSNEEALAKATERAHAALARLPKDRRGPSTYYEGRPFREPILQDCSGAGIRSLITRNSFGCDVLNTDGVGFADLDCEPLRTSLWANLFGSAKKQLAEHQQRWEQLALSKLREWQRNNPSWGLRIYRTAGGLRVLVISKPVRADDEAKQWLASIGSDPLYRRLCADQKSFRARLTPKPWRCGVRQLDVRFPCSSPKDEQRLAAWLERYQEKSGGFAVCEYIETAGPDTSDAVIRPVLELHDARTLVGSGLPLA
jgi:hypothetical protein